MNIKDLKQHDRPRERLIAHGPRALSDVELLAILIGSGTKNCPVLDIASQMLSSYSLPELKDLNYEDMTKLKGIKSAKACILLASFELARRGCSPISKKVVLDSPEKIYHYILHEVYLESKEVVLFILVDCKLHPLKVLVEHSDSTHQVNIPLKRIVGEAISSKAYGVILIHNHPSGDVVPSQADIESTLELQQFLLSLDILLLEHLVVSPTEYYSLHSHGLIGSLNEYSLLGDLL